MEYREDSNEGSVYNSVCIAHGPTMEALEKLRGDLAWSNKIGKVIISITGSTLALLFPLTLSLGVFLSDVRTQIKLHDLSIRKIEIQLDKIDYSLEKLDEKHRLYLKTKKKLQEDGLINKDSDLNSDND